MNIMATLPKAHASDNNIYPRQLVATQNQPTDLFTRLLSAVPISVRRFTLQCLESFCLRIAPSTDWLALVNQDTAQITNIANRTRSTDCSELTEIKIIDSEPTPTAPPPPPTFPARSNLVRINTLEKLHVENYSKNDPIYDGDNSKVYKCTLRSEPEGESILGALKVVTTDDESSKKLLKTELAVISKIQQNDQWQQWFSLPKFHCMSHKEFGSADKPVPVFTMERHGQDLHNDFNNRLAPRGGGLSVNRLMKISEFLFAATNELHKVGIIHRDIKPENVLLQSNGSYLLTDFGMALDFSDQKHDFMECGSPNYVAPEVLKSHPLHDAYLTDPRPADVFSIGASLYTMLYADLYPFFKGRAQTPVLCKRNQALPHITHKNNTVISRLEDLIDRCIAINPADRPTTEEALEALKKIRASASEPKSQNGINPLNEINSQVTRRVVQDL